MKSSYISKRYWNSISTPMGESTSALGKYHDLINFSLGDPDLTTDERIIKKAFEDALNGHTHYTDFYGVRELREVICNFYDEEISKRRMYDNYIWLPCNVVNIRGYFR